MSKSFVIEVSRSENVGKVIQLFHCQKLDLENSQVLNGQMKPTRCDYSNESSQCVHSNSSFHFVVERYSCFIYIYILHFFIIFLKV